MEGGKFISNYPELKGKPIAVGHDAERGFH